MTQENKGTKNKAFEFYEKHGFRDGDEFIDWLEAERDMGTKIRLKSRKQTQNIIFTMLGILYVVVSILCILQFKS
ncbi:MAG: DUF2934 domain-containing protein [Elusimicrobia bacterium]|nr:DUF2934 domain-containing protein [Candidatus Liberimonas magnetica]